MVAAVLLIAFTVAVGGIISLWLTGFAGRTTGTVETQVTNQTKCAGVFIAVDKVTDTTILYSNPSSQPISSISIAVDGITITPTTTTLDPGAVASQSWTRGANTSVIVKGLCLASVPVEGRCEQGDACWEWI